MPNPKLTREEEIMAKLNKHIAFQERMCAACRLHYGNLDTMCGHCQAMQETMVMTKQSIEAITV